MTKKDYVLIAKHFKNCIDSIRWTRNDGGQIIDSIIWVHADNLAKDLKNENQRFDRQKFMEACGLKAV